MTRSAEQQDQAVSCAIDRLPDIAESLGDRYEARKLWGFITDTSADSLIEDFFYCAI